MRVLFASGGTGGHIYPGLTLAGELLARGGHEVLFVGTERGLEGELVPRAGYELEFIHSGPLAGNVVNKAKSLLSIGRGVAEAKRIILKFRPQVVVGTGGYACGPVVMAARILGVPVLLQEQNAIPGKANRLLSRGAQIVALGYSQAAPFFPKSVQGKIRVTGNPIRSQLLSQGAEGSYGLLAGKTTVLLMGASQGARRLNQAAKSLYELAGQGQIQLLHQSGPKLFSEAQAQLEEVATEYGGKVEQEGEGLAWRGVHLYPYLYDMASAYRQTDLVISRAGAISLAEIAALGLPAILVPYPHAAANHQFYNARALQEAGAAIMLEDRSLTGELLAGEVTGLLADSTRLQQMASSSGKLGKKEATAQIVDLILETRK